MDANMASYLAENTLARVDKGCRDQDIGKPGQDRDGCLHSEMKTPEVKGSLFPGTKSGRQKGEHLGVTLNAKLKCGPQVCRIIKKAWAIIWATKWACGTS